MIKTIILLGFVCFVSFSQAQSTDFHNSYVSSSVGIAIPLGEFSSADWYNNQSVSLACSGITWDVITYGKFLNKNVGIGGKLNATLNPMYDNETSDKKPSWTSIDIGIGGMYNMPKPKWDYGVELWISYMWLSGTSIRINDELQINSPFFGMIIDLSPTLSYHFSPRNSLVLKSSIAGSLKRVKHGYTPEFVPSKKYQMLRFKIGVRHWIL